MKLSGPNPVFAPFETSLDYVDKRGRSRRIHFPLRFLALERETEFGGMRKRKTLGISLTRLSLATMIETDPPSRS